MNEQTLRDKIKKIEILFASTTSSGEKLAAEEAIKRIKAKLSSLKNSEKEAEYRFSVPDRWSRQVFITLCRRYGLKPYRYGKQRQSSIMIKAPKTFIQDVLYPEYHAINGVLMTYLGDITEKLIKSEIYHDVSEPKELKTIEMI